MKKAFSLLVTLLILFMVMTDCARRDRPSGGPKDEDAPIMVDANPPHFTTNFDKDEIKIVFDEFIKLQDLNTQLIVSPPLKYPPIIKPLGVASKTISIKILDTLKENTTYTFNFGQSVIDNAEGNVLRNYKYVFSTGDIIDSLSVQGIVKDAFNREADKNVTVMLYESNEAFTDSVIYNQKPLYVGNSLDSTIWEISNIKAGQYRLVALMDVAKNYKFDPKQDKIAFIEETITVPTDSIFIMNLFKEVLPYSIKRPSEVSKGHLYLAYQGKADSLQVVPLNESQNFKSFLNFEKDKDSANFWFQGNSHDSLMLKVINHLKTDTLVVRLRNKITDSLELKSNTRGLLPLNDQFELLSNTPLATIDTTRIKFIDSDSLGVAYRVTVANNRQQLSLNFKKKYNHKYHLEILPAAISDFFGNTNDTLRYNLNTKEPEDYGKLFLTLGNVKQYPIIVQLITEKGTLVQEIYSEEEQEYEFINIEPAKHLIRIIKDENGNKKWDAGNFLLKKQPEEVIYFSTLLDIRANWEMTETFILK